MENHNKVKELIQSYSKCWALLQAHDDQTLLEPETKSDSPQTLSERESIIAIAE